jgi:SAM-dependent methyltransferase
MPMTDREVTRVQYADDAHLSARQRLWRYGTTPSLARTALDLAGLRGTETVVDVGCGNGAYLAELRRRGHTGAVLGFDLSPGMARTAGVFAGTAVADAQHLPLCDASVDLALSMHMLYHVPDIHRAITELRRVLRPGAAALVATNGAGHTAEAKAILAAAASRVAGLDVDQHWDTRRFDTEVAATMLAAVFDDVTVVDVGGAAAAPEPSIVTGYIASWPPESLGLPSGPVWSAILAEVRRIVAAHFAEHQTLTVTSRTTVLIGR